MKYLVISSVLIALFLCSCRHNLTDTSTSHQDSTLQAEITEDMAYQGVSNYCHEKYDWSIAEENPSIMYLQKGEETPTEYQVIFRSYTGAFVYFHVNKSNGSTRMVEHVPSLNVKSEAGTIELSDYLK